MIPLAIPPNLDPAAASRVAVLVDCDNTSPEILEHALLMVAQFGRVVIPGIGPSSH